ncbi:26S protease regulatory subunit 6A like protein [Tritrichomonas foetus]|uniref:26S protease regulatory subunit 6A like protein n=1 Tax=Tritrichomonas foetus TaxID=1144522 RepID=A0A1J4JBT8_9EUKA|nr:26S protease regulatory subunit 6A like protein [Tritrichomonas foetus]|eukprot:OHS94877.1 26S protease regulatory subunit 6A like protein [Tritrichomonas foetus]
MATEEVAINQDLVQEMSMKSLAEIRHNIQLLDNNIKTSERALSRFASERKEFEEHINQYQTVLAKLKITPYLVSNVVETFKLEEADADETYQGAGEQLSAVIKTTHRDTVFLPVTGLIQASDLKPSDIIGVNKDTFVVYEKLPPNYDARVQAMEVGDRPSETYDQCGGLDKQIQELKEAVVLPITNPERLQKIGIQAPKGVLLYGPPGTGKTMLARACAATTNSNFFRLSGPMLVQKYIGEGARIVREVFELAREKAPSIIFIDEIDAVGGKRSDAENTHGEREVSRTMLELLNQLDGFSELNNVKVICATNRPDTLDPALMRAGRLDRKIELPMPDEEARVAILKIHSSKMTVGENVNFREIARSTEDFNGAMLKAVCVEAGMCALRRNGESLTHDDFIDGIAQVQAKKTKVLNYFS